MTANEMATLVAEAAPQLTAAVSPGRNACTAGQDMTSHHRTE